LNWSEVPCIMVEMGFMTHPEEDLKLVDPEYQRRGLGKMLFHEIQSRLPHTRAWLCTCQEVKSTYEFYLREGFQTYKSEDMEPNLTWVYMEKNK
ncbi:MAG: GNAT family N-acetyltransferase, partial [Paludibacteraceae bacterium]|nr:GNAT family N-acetyltransferase [Paludibacteraceae bacterium]